MLTTEQVDQFIDGYVDCALWADCWPTEAETLTNESWESGGREHLTIRPDARERMAQDCRAFCVEAVSDLVLYADERNFDPAQGSAYSYAGHDFWLTRSGHGAGFWDRGLGELGDRLTDAAKRYGSPDDHTPFDAGDGTADC